MEAGQDDYIKERCSPKGLIFKPARLQLDWSASFQSKGDVIFDF